MDENEEGKTVEVKERTSKEEELKEEKKAEKQEDNKEIILNQTKEKKKKWRFIAIFIAILIVLSVFASIIFSLINLNNTKIMNGVSIKNIDVSGLTSDEAKQKLNEIVKLELEKNIELKYKDFEITISPEQIEANYDIESAIQKAYEVGRKGNIVLNNYDILNALLKKKNIEPSFSYNDEKLGEIISDISKKLPDAVAESAYYIEDGYLIITKGHYGTVINEDTVKEAILGSIKSKDNKIIEIEVSYKEPDKIDVDKIYSEVHTEPQNAYYETNPFKIYAHVDGVDFAISLEEARSMLEHEQEEYKIPLKYTEPEITTSKIGTEAFPDLLASFSTKYDASNTNRSTNMELAGQKINELVLMPGEEFSYNKVVGKRTPEAGFKPAGVYEGGKVVTGYGGGICQVSSTLYNTVVLANLEILERKNHQFLTGYVAAGRDATVNYGTIDFRFRNSRKYPVKIICNVSNGICEVKLYGAKEEVEYIVKIESKVTGSIPYTTSYEENPNMEIGQERVIQSGANGCRSIAYKILILNGSVVSQEVLSEDTYSAMNRIIQRGTKGPTVVKTDPNPEPVAEPVQETHPEIEENNTETEEITAEISI